MPPDRPQRAPATHLFVGDTLFAGSIGRTDFPGGDYEVLMRSITEVIFLSATRPSSSGHGPDTTIARERTTNPFVLNIWHGTLICFLRRDQLDAPHARLDAGLETRRLDPRAVDVGAVGALEVAQVELAGRQRRKPPVHARHQRRVDDEVRTGRTADGANAAERTRKVRSGMSSVIVFRIHMRAWAFYRDASNWAVE